MEQSGETANLAILDGTEAVFIAQVQCREMMRILVKLGSRVPLHASDVGKAIVAALPDERIKQLGHVVAHTAEDLTKRLGGRWPHPY
jgi:IclR family acetate operon transcriptional repressor